MSDVARFFHETWLGMAQPIEGLVVSIPALLEADASERQPADVHRAFEREHLEAGPDGAPRLVEPRRFLVEGLGWGDALEDAGALPEDLSLYVPEGPQTVRPTCALQTPAHQVDADAPAPSPAAEAARAYRLLVLELPPGPDRPGGELGFDKPETVTGDWDYPPAKKLERLLRECRCPIGVLVSRRALRLLYAPHGEAAGHIDFRFADLADVGGRPLFDALHLLLGRDRLFNVAPDRQLHRLLARSREMQAEVTTELSGQVFSALETLLRGFEAADARAGGDWLRPVMEQGHDARDVLFDALLTVLLRLVFLLYAEDAGLLPTAHPLYQRHYSLYALFDRLEAEHTQHPDAMDRRYSAWPGLLALFRVVYLGASHGDMRLPAREGHLFDPHRFPFLEGFDADAASVPLRGAAAEARASASVPTVDDGTVYRVLRSLIYLGGSRLSYRALQVEQIGSVYEGLMGWRTLRVVSPSVRVKPSDSKTAPQWVSVEQLYAVPKAQREKWLKTEVGLKGKRGKQLAKDLAALQEEHAASEAGDADASALERRALSRLEEERVKTSDVAQPGRVVIQPGEERKRTSSHYTPPELSGPIVARALEPLLACMGDAPTSAQILSLKVCDPAMGSGAFLVEACRWLGERLLEAWTREGVTASAFGEADDLTTYARRQVAERCLYGVDKNPVAVEIAKLSLWLVTLQHDKPFTFLDHSLRCGDSLVGCSLAQITEFHWSPAAKKNEKGAQLDLFDRELADSLNEALRARERIAEQSEHDTPEANRRMRDAMRDADDALVRLRLIGDLLIGAFFSEKKNKAREQERKRRKGLVEQWLLDVDAIGPPEDLVALADETRRALRPFHWMLEFPEVFWGGRVDPLTGRVGASPAYLDAVIGNPPFLGGTRISANYGTEYRDWLAVRYLASSLTDLCAYFFRRAAELLGEHGTAGYIATNSISQGASRTTSLEWLARNGARIYEARTSFPWPGDVAVMVCVVHFALGSVKAARRLNGKPVEKITAFLAATGGDSPPLPLSTNRRVAVIGSFVLGKGFLFADDDPDATPVATMRSMIDANPRTRDLIRRYVVGRDLNSHPRHLSERFIIDMGERTEEEASRWPALMSILQARVKPARASVKQRDRREDWWKHATRSGRFRDFVGANGRALACSQTTTHLAFAFVDGSTLLSHTCVMILARGFDTFSVVQARPHGTWARFFGSSMKSDLRYTPTDCFETFPFPKPDPRAELPALEAIGQTLYETRAKFMVDTDQGLTKTYNALKDPGVTARSEHGERVVHLRDLHVEMDRAVLQAYADETGDPTWTDVDVPPFTDPVTPAEKDLHQRFEDHVLDKLFELNAIRAGR